MSLNSSFCYACIVNFSSEYKVDGQENYCHYLHFLICENATGLMSSPIQILVPFLVLIFEEIEAVCVCVCVWNAKPHVIHPPQQTVSLRHLIVSSKCNSFMWVIHTSELFT